MLDVRSVPHDHHRQHASQCRVCTVQSVHCMLCGYTRSYSPASSPSRRTCYCVLMGMCS
jgi:hypothetical protein